VKVWNAIPTSDINANVALGDDDLTGPGSGGCGDAILNSPAGLAIAGGKVFVADYDNSRVLIWNSIPTDSGIAADLVLGQDAMDECLANDVNHDGVGGDSGASSSTLANPTAVWSNGTKLIVADSGNNRVLIWNTIPTTNAQPADVVVGQVDFTATGSATGADGLSEPWDVISNGTQLVIADSDNNRVLLYETMPSTDGALADVVLGQGDFTHVTENDQNQDDSQDTEASANTLYWPSGPSARRDSADQLGNQDQEAVQTLETDGSLPRFGQPA
jgi:hypothetical protein